MSHVTLDDATRDKLSGANGGPLEMRDMAGGLVGFFLTPDAFDRIRLKREGFDAWVDAMFPREEIEKSLADPRPSRTMDEVLKLVEGD